VPTVEAHHVRDLDTIDCELRLLVAVRRVCREEAGRVPSIGVIDELLDERRSLQANTAPGVSWRQGVGEST
jgi:hypothetical protein